MTKRTICLMMAALCVLAVCGQAFAHPGGIDTPNPNLPPAGVYLTPQDVHAMYSGGALSIVLKAIQHRPFVPGQTSPQPDGEHHQFHSTMDGLISVNGSPLQPIHAEGMVETVAYGKTTVTGGPFQTEMLSMSLQGNSPLGPFTIRESPSKASTGQTSITDIGGGLYHIDSFFDVFTELDVAGLTMQSIDDGGGPASTHVVLGIPEPATATLLGLAFLGVAGLARRRR